MNPKPEIEFEFGVPFPGRVLPRAAWVRTALHELPVADCLDWTQIFGRTAPRIVDLGCGNGRFTIASALARPELDHLGIDALPVVIRHATRRANQRGVSNVRFAVGDAGELIRRAISPGSLTEVHLYHPQPYYDPSAAHKRLVTPDFLASVHRALVPAGRFVVQTDNPGYWKYLALVVPHFFEFQEHVPPWPDAPRGRTRREIVARQQGLSVWRGVGKRRGDVDEAAACELARQLPPPRFDADRRLLALDRLA